MTPGSLAAAVAVVAFLVSGCRWKEEQAMTGASSEPASSRDPGEPAESLRTVASRVRSGGSREDEDRLRRRIAATGLRREIRCDGQVMSLAVDGPGRRWSVGSFDGCARIFTAAGSDPVVLQGHGGFVSAMAFDADGVRFATGDRDGVVRVWTVGGDLLRRFPSRGPVTILVEFAGGDSLLCVCRLGAVRLLGLSDGGVREVRAPGEPVLSADVSPDGRLVALGTERGTVVLVHLEDGSISERAGPGGVVTRVEFSPSGRDLLVSASAGRPVVLTVADGAAAAVPVGGGEDRFAAYSPDGMLIALASPSGAVSTRGVEGGSGSTWSVGGPVTGIRFSRDGDRLRLLGPTASMTVIRRSDGSLRRIAALRPSAVRFPYEWTCRDVIDLDGQMAVAAWEGDSAWLIADGSGPVHGGSGMADPSREELLSLSEAIAEGE